MKAYRAYSKHGANVADSARAAALAHFDRFPSARKCAVTSGTVDGDIFTVVYGRASLGHWPESWKDVTRKTAHTLPDAADDARLAEAHAKRNALERTLRDTPASDDASPIIGMLGDLNVAIADMERSRGSRK